jgi:DNA-binding NarL/FixJ family response regulator
MQGRSAKRKGSQTSGRKPVVLRLTYFGYSDLGQKEQMVRAERAQRQSGPGPAAVLIVDGDRDYRKLVTKTLERAGFASRAVATGEEAIAFARKQRPAAVILDVILPGATGYEVCRELRETYGEDLPIVFISGDRVEAPDRVVGLLLGADDYLVKPVDPDELTARLRRLITRAATLAAEAGQRSETFAQLTTRESEVLRLLASGLNQEDIARSLEISPATVGTHIQRVLSKLDVHSRTQAVALAYREKLVEQA